MDEHLTFKVTRSYTNGKSTMDHCVYVYDHDKRVMGVISKQDKNSVWRFSPDNPVNSMTGNMLIELGSIVNNLNKCGSIYCVTSDDSMGIKA